MATSPIPVTVLTGYLGSGKTTLLNRILSNSHGRKYAVIVNEFGEIGIDNDLIVESDEEIYDMKNGCVCCTIRGDLARVIERLMRRRGRFDAILVETTGLANPAPVAQTFFLDDDVREKVQLDAVVALADAKHLLLRLKDAPEAEEQIAFADVVVLNKLDLVNEDELAEVEAAIRRLNPSAEIIRAERADVPLERILDRGSFDLDRILAADPAFLNAESDHGHPDHDCGPGCDQHHKPAPLHDSSINSVSLRAGEVDPKRFFPWINRITQIDGRDILRLKGILAFPHEDERYVVHGIHMIVEGDHQRLWREDEARESRLVFIGRGLDREKLERTFAACAIKTAATADAV
ncbi:MAG: GTP-binding protein [Pseudomonadota bacterium]